MLAPETLLETLHEIERQLGRQRRERWGPRTVDLDLLLYDQVVVESGHLVLPHPSMAFRRFVLEPAAEVAGSMLHPTIGWTVRQLLDHLNTARAYVAIAGPIGAGKTLLAEQLARRSGVRWIVEQFDARRLEQFCADPAGTAWAVELEFLHQRARLLAADLAEWSATNQFSVSDFWFDQSWAFASVWLPGPQQEAYRRRWERARCSVVQPKLTVLLDAPTEVLLERIRCRGCPGEQRLDAPTLERIRGAIVGLALRPGIGPVLRIPNGTPEQVLEETSAAIESMEG